MGNVENQTPKPAVLPVDVVVGDYCASYTFSLQAFKARMGFLMWKDC